MTLFEILGVLLTFAALLSYVNHRFLKLPTTIGIMVLSLLLSLLVVVIGSVVPGLTAAADSLLRQIDFSQALMHGMLGYLLFAGALHIDLGDLTRHKLVVLVLASVGVLLSTLLVGSMTWGVVRALGIEMKLVHCFLFGALISPTDPIAVLALLKRLGAPPDLATKIAGESLFNDGVGVVVFMVVAELAGGGAQPPLTGLEIAELLMLETVGGVVFGLAIGLVAYRLLKSVDSYQVEVLLSLALVTGGYAAAEALHVSAPIAMVVAGVLIGNHGRAFAMSDRTRQNLDTFWELIDEILNAVLFALIGLEVLVLSFSGRYLLVGLLAIPITLGARLISVGVPITLLRRVREISPHTVKVLTWGGLRGGISVALALSLSSRLTEGESGVFELIVVMTYLVVAFSIITQGLTMSRQMRRWGLTDPDGDA